MNRNNTLAPSWFELTVYVLRGILAVCRHFVKYRFSYCARRVEKPSSYGQQYKTHQFASQITLKDQRTSSEPYLRPTRQCNSLAPEIVSLASHFRNCCNSDWDYACAIYDFVCNEVLYMVVMPPPHGVVDTLKRGYGSCVDKINLLIALARAGGIPARYCVIDSRIVALGPPEMVGRKVNIYDWVMGHGLGFNAKIHFNLKTRERKDLAVLMHLGFRLRHFLGRHEHPHAELKIGGFWVQADPSFDKYFAAGFNYPVQKLGYDPFMLWGLTGNVIARTAEAPREPQERLHRRYLCAFTCGEGSCLNLATDEVRVRGKQVLDEVGESEYMRSKLDYYVPLPEMDKLAVSLTV